LIYFGVAVSGRGVLTGGPTKITTLPFGAPANCVAPHLIPADVNTLCSVDAGVPSLILFAKSSDRQNSAQPNVSEHATIIPNSTKKRMLIGLVVLACFSFLIQTLLIGIFIRKGFGRRHQDSCDQKVGSIPSSKID